MNRRIVPFIICLLILTSIISGCLLTRDDDDEGDKDNIVFHTSFEFDEYDNLDPSASSPPGWSTSIFAGDIDFTWDATNSHSGQRSLKQEHFNKTSNSGWRTDLLDLIEKKNELFTFTLWIKTEVTGEPGGAGGRLWIEWRNENDQVIKQNVLSQELKTNGEWQKWGTVLEAPEGAVKIRIMLQHINFHGCTWWDDITVYRGNVLNLEEGIMTRIE